MMSEGIVFSFFKMISEVLHKISRFKLMCYNKVVTPAPKVI